MPPRSGKKVVTAEIGFEPTDLAIRGEVVHGATGLGIAGLSVELVAREGRTAARTLARTVSGAGGSFLLSVAADDVAVIALVLVQGGVSAAIAITDERGRQLASTELALVNHSTEPLRIEASSDQKPPRSAFAALSEFLIASRRARIEQIAADLSNPAADSPVRALTGGVRLALLDSLERGARTRGRSVADGGRLPLDSDQRVIDPRALKDGRFRIPTDRPRPDDPLPPGSWGVGSDAGSFLSGLRWARPDDISYRDYLRGVAVLYAHEQALGFYGDLAKWTSTVERQLDHRFFQDFRTQDRTPDSLNRQLIRIVSAILKAPVGSGFGFAISAGSIPAQKQKSDREYLDLLIGLSGIGSSEFQNRYRLPLGEPDATKWSPVELNIYSLKLVLSDTAQGPVEPEDNVIDPQLPGYAGKPIFWDNVVGAAPFFLRFEEWLDSQKPFYPENLFDLRSQIQACVRGSPWMDAETEAFLNYHQGRPPTQPVSSYRGQFDSADEARRSAEFLIAFGMADRKLFELVGAIDRKEYATALRLVDEAGSLLTRARPKSQGEWEPAAMPNSSSPRPMSFAKRRNLPVTDITKLTGTPRAYPVSGFERYFELPRLGGLWEFVDLFSFSEARYVATRLVKYQRAFLLPILEARCHFELGHYGQAIDILAGLSGFFVGTANLITPPGAAKIMDLQSQYNAVHQGGSLPYTARLTYKDRKRQTPEAFIGQVYVFNNPIPELTTKDLNRLELNLLRLIQAEVMLEWAEQFYRTNGPSEIERARELYKGVIFLHREEPGTTAYSADILLPETWLLQTNPRRRSQLVRASLALQQIGDGLNFYGYRQDAVPTLRYSTLVDAAGRWATAAKAEQSDFLASLQRMEQLDLDLLAAKTQKAKAEAATQIAAAQIDAANASVIVANKLVTDVQAQITAKQKEIDDANSIFGQFKAYLGGMKDSVTSIVDVGKSARSGADTLGISSEAATNAAVKDLGADALSGTGVAGGLAAVGLFGAFAGLSAVSLQGMADAANKRDADLKALKEQSLPVAQAAVRIQQAQVQVAQGQAAIAAAELAYASDLIRYYAERFLNREFWTAVADISARVMRRQLDLAARAAWFAERALAYQIGRSVSIIRLTYFDRSMRDIGGVDRLLLDLSELEAVRLGAARLTLPIKCSYSMARDLPLAFGALKQSGSARFSLDADELRRLYPGTFAHRIRAVDIAIEAPGVYPPPRGVLRNAGISFLSQYNDKLPLVRFEDALPVSDFKTRSDMAIQEMPGEQLMPFEGSGFTTEWLIDLVPGAVGSGLGRLSDVILTFDIRCDYAAGAPAPPPSGSSSFAALLSGLAFDPDGLGALLGTGPSASLLFPMSKLALPGLVAGSKITNVAVLLPGVDSGSVNASIKTPGPDLSFTIKDGLALSNAGHLSDGVAAHRQPLNGFAGTSATDDIGIDVQKGTQAKILKQARDLLLWIEYEPS